jgi:hypothetical protein
MPFRRRADRQSERLRHRHPVMVIRRGRARVVHHLGRRGGETSAVASSRPRKKRGTGIEMLLSASASPGTAREGRPAAVSGE